ncbi:glycosyltransferase family 2 protein [Bradyrhizobium commune]|uniref:Glycosyltransferase family 2 protein n=1 Tax=Bradyrhizobium commune TaxID=83627 RepID=A0A7S9GY97_9BRAD|nr:glycosyltransferase family A protein [Bradyrhizobium commune]QPF90268.1 glycosyltransferase family 2 protein [Bradyrhizobium commune]
MLSVIIANHNYAHFLRQAIDSALALDWPNIEVIVVDDGSTDGSHAIIKSYGDKIRGELLPKSTQLDVRNHGFAISKGGIVSFLDSDDLLDPQIMRRAMAVWGDGVSKVQVQMGTIDADGRNLNSDFPRYQSAPTADECRTWILTTSSYPTPPGSGNLYARWFLERIFPLDHSCGDATDSCCVTAAPLLGDVVTIVDVLASYRVHGNNLGAMADLQPRRLHRQIVRAQQRFDYMTRIAGVAGLKVSAPGPQLSLHYLMYRTASYRIAPEEHPLRGDSSLNIVRDAFAAVCRPQGIGVAAKLTVFVWICAVLCSPRSLSEWLMRVRFDSQYRAVQKAKLTRATAS